jgi:hypothetical protein
MFIPDPDFLASLDPGPDPGSNNNNKDKEEGEKIFYRYPESRIRIQGSKSIVSRIWVSNTAI